MAKQTKKIPVKHVIGYVTSVLLTLLAAWAALDSNLPIWWIIISIIVLAIIQVAIQLFLFMHITERGAGHTPWNMMFHGTIMLAILVAGSLFTMSFGFTHDYNGEHEGHEQEKHIEQEE